MALSEYLKGEVVQDYADGFLSRREALRRLGLYGLTLTGASALLAACGGDDDTASTDTTTSSAGGTATTAAGGPTSTSPAGQKAQLIKFPGPAGELQGAYAAAAQPRASVLVIHENRGLTPHFYDLVGRFSNEGYAALCPPLLQGGHRVAH
jgi:carboxymethylenebutenolidase